MKQIWGFASPSARAYGELTANMFSPDKELLTRIALALGLDASDIREVSLWYGRGNEN